MTTAKKIDFEALEKIDVTPHIDKKGRFSYLSWPYAVSAFRKACPDGYWRICGSEAGPPYAIDGSGAYVVVTVHTHQDCPGFTQVHPVLNHQNKPILKPNAFDVNTSIQRCLVKAIALATGIGLHIYAGEDLPPDSEDTPPRKTEPTPQQKQSKLTDKLMLNLNNATSQVALDSIHIHPAFIADMQTVGPEAAAMVEECYKNKCKQFAEVASNEAALGGPPVNGQRGMSS